MAAKQDDGELEAVWFEHYGGVRLGAVRGLGKREAIERIGGKTPRGRGRAKKA